MMRLFLRLCFATLCIATLLPSALVQAAAPQPTTAGRTLRMAFLQGGEFLENTAVLHATARALQQLDLVQNVSTDMYEPKTVEELWHWLAANTNGRVTFVSDAFYDGQHDIAKRKENKKSLQARIKNKKDVDLVLTFGTPGGIDMSTGMEPTPVFVISTTDPVAAGISASPQKSGRDNVYVVVEDMPYLHQVLLFKQIFNFKTLGICYENSKEGRAVIAYDELRKASQQLGFSLVEGIINEFSQNEDHNISQRILCHEKLASKVDAVYLTFGQGSGHERYKELLAPLLAAKVPTFSQRGEKDVEAGALLSMSGVTSEAYGVFVAHAIRQFLEGKKLEQINQLYKEDIDLVLNLRNATEIGWKISPRILVAVDKVYSRIQNISK